MRGSMLTEILLTLALAGMIMPFILRQEKVRLERAENIIVAEKMETVKEALEKYIDINRTNLLMPIGQSITRVSLSDLKQFGIGDEFLESDYQLRVLKFGQKSLQGVVVQSNGDLSPLRTAQIAIMADGGVANLGGVNASFGAWHMADSDFKMTSENAIVGTTKTVFGGSDYLWRIPSEDLNDSKMNASLFLMGQDILNVNLADSKSLGISGIMAASEIGADKLIFKNRVTIDGEFNTDDASVSGALSTDAKNILVNNALILADSGNFNNVAAEKLNVRSLNLTSISIANNEIATMRVSGTTDLTGGRVMAQNTRIGFSGSLTARMTISERIEDGVYFWESTGDAFLNDILMSELTRLAPIIMRRENGDKTESGKIWASVSANKNATVSDYLNALELIENKVGAKFDQLGLE